MTEDNNTPLSKEPVTDEQYEENMKPDDNSNKDHADTTEVDKTLNKLDPVTEEDIKDSTPITMPSAIYSKLIELLESINKLTKQDFNSKFTKQDTVALNTNIDSMDYTNTEDMLAIDTDDFINDVSYGSKKLSIRPLPINSKGKALNGDAAIARIASAIGVGETTQVPLWHSGFWVTFKPIKDVELVNLDIQLTNNQITLGRETNTLVFSNYSVVFNRIVTNFIVNHIQNTTLDLPAGEDITKYIATQDLYTLVNAMLYSMYPRGYTLSRTCSNSVNLDEDGIPECDYVLTGKIDFRKLLWVDRKSLSKEHMNIMSKRNPNSVTVDDVLEYQNTLKVNKDKIVNLTTSSGEVIKLTLKTPTLNDYIENGEKWVNEVITKSEAVFTDTTNVEEKNAIIEATTTAMVLGIYNIYINKITLDDGSTIEDRTDIDNILNIFSGDPKILKETITSIKEYINNNNISLIGLPNYHCPKCTESQNIENHSNFKEIIPINILESFFDLCVFRITNLREKNIL